MMTRRFLLIAGLSVAYLLSCTEKRETYSTFIFQEDLFGQCHASTIVEIDSGVLMSAWFGGSYEGAKDVSVWASYYRDSKWEEPVKLANGIVNQDTFPCWNPVLYMSATKRLFLYYKVGPNPREWWGMVLISDNLGDSWSEPVRLPENVLGPIKNKPISLGNGTFLAPSSVETLDDRWLAHVEIFSDNGEYITSLSLDHGDSICAIQPSVLVHPNNTLQLLCRSRQNLIAQTWSFDGGYTWEPMSLINVKNPNSGNDAVTITDGRHLLVYNPLESGKDWWLGRNILNLAISDNGLDWNTVVVLENQDQGEYSYPAIIQDSNGMIHITYTWDRKRIKHVILDPNLY